MKRIFIQLFKKSYFQKSKKKKKKNKSSPDLARRNEICSKYDASTAPFDFNKFTDFFENPKLETYEIYR